MGVWLGVWLGVGCCSCELDPLLDDGAPCVALFVEFVLVIEPELLLLAEPLERSELEPLLEPVPLASLF